MSAVREALLHVAIREASGLDRILSLEFGVEAKPGGRSYVTVRTGRAEHAVFHIFAPGNGVGTFIKTAPGGPPVWPDPVIEEVVAP